MTDQRDRPTPRAAIFAAVALAGIAALLVFAAWSGDARLNVPAWLAYAISGGLCAAGLAIVARSLGRERLALVFVLLLLASFTITGAWIGFGPGVRRCSASGFGFGGPASDTECRVAFGIGALISLAMTLFVLAQLRRQR